MMMARLMVTTEATVPSSVEAIRQATAGTVRGDHAALEDRIGSDHLSRNQIVSDAKMIERGWVCAPHNLSGGIST
jgi:hypothetical protein